MGTVNFDRVADAYDATRALPEWVTARCADTILQTASPHRPPRILEIGVGTGRISAALLARGVPVVGIDVSREMLARNVAKLGGPERRNHLVRGDITSLPFESRAFDAILGVHILHLIERWGLALEEAIRVLDRGGSVYLAGEGGGCSSRDSAVRQTWLSFLRERGIPIGPPGATDEEPVEYLESRGATTHVYGPWTWTFRHTHREALARIENRVFSQAWIVPEEIMEDSIRRVREWILETAGSLDALETYERAFTLRRFTFP